LLSGATTRAEALSLLRRAFAEGGLDTPDLDARILMAEALGIEASGLALRPRETLGALGAERLRGYAARRVAHEPVARILSHQEFWGLPFELSPETLVPRPETETVVEAALAGIGRDAPARILDLGTGSGCLLVALLHELTDASGVGVDRSPAALATARENARRNGVGDRAGFAASDWGAALAGKKFELVVSNPPYVATATIAGLAPEVRDHDPQEALDGGPDGLAAYRSIFSDAGRLLAPGGRLVVEIGFDQEPGVRALAAAAGLAVQRVAKDLGGRPRAVVMAPP
jgi:release factor glutamine methyltransferase